MKFKMARLLLTALLWLASSYSFAQGPPTTSSPPGPPTIGIANAGDSSATVSFAAPDDNGGSVITGYTVTSTPGSVTATGISSPITVTDLNNGTSYAFTVRATNDAGDGAASSASNSVTPTGSLGGVPVCYITPTNAVIAYGASQPFSASCSNNPTGFQWKVNGNLWSLGGAGSTSSETFTGFAAGTYIVAVSAMNLIGTGSPANAILTVTPASTAPVVTQHPSSQTVTAGQAASFTAAASGTPTPAVQWQQSTNSGVSFTNISGATSTTYNFMTTLSNASYQYRAVFTNGIAPDATSDAATLTVNSAGGTAFPPNCQMPTGWTVPSGANAGWIVATDFASEGTCSLKSSPLLDSQKAQIQFVGSLAAGNVTFSRKVSSEAGYDCLQFYVDGIQQNDGGACGVSATSGVSGEVPWGSVSFPVTAGVHTLLWSYEKDASVSANQDAAWIDAVVLPGATGASLPTLSSVSPTTMAVNSGDQPLYLIGSNFQDGNVLQWQWDTTAGTWNSFVVTPASGSLLSVTMNPGAVARTMYLRVCRSTAQPTTADCSASASVSVTSVVAPFIDDQFNGTSLDSQLWTNGGNSVTIHNGYLDLQANQTDNTGWVKTTFPERQHIRVEMRHQMHAANGYFFPSITLGATNPNGQVTVRWLRSAYASDYCNLAANYDRVEILAGVNSSASCQWTFSNLVSSSYYDRWIVSILDYDVATGLVTLDTDSDGVIDFTATVTPANRSPITSVHLQGYGWNTGHLHQVDYIKVFDFDPSHLMLPQTISLGAAPSVMVGGTGVLNATSSSGLPVSFTVLPANGKCTVAGATVTGLAVGLCYVYVDQPGNGTYAPAPQVMQVFSVATNLTPPSAPSITSIVAGLGRVSINFTQPTSTGGGPIVSFSATCTAPGRTPRTSTGTGSQVVVRGLAGGVSYSCSLTASNGSYASVASVAVTVIPAKIDLTPILMLLLD